MQTHLTHLECGWCHKTYDANRLMNMCPECDKPLLARYDLEAARKTLTRENLLHRAATLWRYAEVLPVQEDTHRLSLGEGCTPLLKVDRLGTSLGLKQLYVKDESANPTRSFKARGMAVAIGRAAELGAKAIAVPSAGNAGSAMSAYSARAGLPAHVYLPRDIDELFITEARALGANVQLVDGLINDCGRYVKEGADAGRWFDVSTLKEPYRVEGKKTMAYELIEDLNGRMPDVLIYPTGGGTGIIGMWKAFEEMEELGWIGSERPRIVSVQAAGCAPIVDAFKSGARTAEFWEGAETLAHGLRVPGAVGDFLILDALRESNGTAIAVEDDEILEAINIIGKNEGIFVSPEAAATYAALKHLVAEEFVHSDEMIVLFVTGDGLKHTSLVSHANGTS